MLHKKTLLKSLEACMLTTSKDESHVNFSGVLFSFRKGILRLVSSNGHGLTLIDIKTGDWGKEKEVVVGAHQVKALIQMLKLEFRDDLISHVEFKDNKDNHSELIFKSDLDYKVWTSTIVFPDYEHIIPTIEEGDSVERIGFNLKYITDTCKAFKGFYGREKIIQGNFDFKNNTSACIITPDRGKIDTELNKNIEDIKIILMPMRV